MADTGDAWREFGIHYFCVGALPASKIIYGEIAARGFRLENNFRGSLAQTDVLPSVPVALIVEKNGAQIGEIRFDLSKFMPNHAVFETIGDGPINFYVRDVLHIKTPADLHGLADIVLAIPARLL